MTTEPVLLGGESQGDFFTECVLYSERWKELYVFCWLFLESNSCPMYDVLCEHALEFLLPWTWPVGRLPPTLMCICWSVVGSECPDRLAMDFGGAGAAQQGLTDSCQSGGGIGCTQNGERWDLTGLCPD